MNALVQVPSEAAPAPLGMSTALALTFMGWRMRNLVEGLVAKGCPPRQACRITILDRRLHAVLAFDAQDEHLQVPLDIWLPRDAG